MSQVLESDLTKISEIIIEKKYPNTRGYGGWFKAFPVRFNKQTNEPFQFDFKNEKDIVALIFLATIWNIDRYKWENAVGLVGVLYSENMLNIKEWSSRSFISKLDKKLLENEMNNLDINSVIKNSEIINKYFGTYYDLPLFDFYDDCLRKSCKGDKCEIYKYCERNIK